MASTKAKQEATTKQENNNTTTKEEVAVIENSVANDSEVIEVILIINSVKTQKSSNP